MSAGTQTTFEHAAVVHAGLEDMLRQVIPLVGTASASGDQVVFEASAGVVTAIADQLAVSAARTGLLCGLARHPHQLLWGLRQLVDEDLDSDRGVFIVHQIDFDTSLAQRSEWGRVEALFNHVLRDRPLRLICLYDTLVTDTDVLAQARATHPEMLRGDSITANPDYEDTRDYLGLRDAGWAVDSLEASEPDAVIGLTAAGDLLTVRYELGRMLDSTTLPEVRRADFAAAVFEITTNALFYGGPNPRVHLWRSGDRVLCRVRDEGPGPDDPLTGYEPPSVHRTTRGDGLWSARQLTDHMTTTREPPGFTVRLSID